MSLDPSVLVAPDVFQLEQATGLFRSGQYKKFTQRPRSPLKTTLSICVPLCGSWNDWALGLIWPEMGLM